ncbi:hypothetical protein [Foetidibacter luteolus]|uniref:hypothetical protein n=1 Tax=Foetidibacter luteolus TaxID=2608880 RepID=UPI00129A8804|nr:hypothetical protein [Foetidibacter luteolus]
MRKTALIALGILLAGVIVYVYLREPPLNQIPKKGTPFCTLLPSSILYGISHDTVTWVGRKTLYWDKKSELRIYFYGGADTLRKKVMKIAQTWAGLSGLRFRQVTSLYDSAEIRISFTCPGYNSLVGKENLQTRNLRIPTMCLEGLDTLKDQPLFTRTVLHEFGHVMGLFHELQSPAAFIPWDTGKLYAYYEREYNWKPDSVDKWVLQLYESVEHSDFDDRSIMLYAVPDEVTKGRFEISWPDKLSQRDTGFLLSNYK